MGPTLKEVSPHMHTLSCWCDVPKSELESWLADIEQMLDAAEFLVLKKDTVVFPGGGTTAVWVLAESHLAVHQFVENNVVYVELTSCNQPKRDKFAELLRVLNPSQAFTRSSSALLEK